jgi:hypothetical protein
MTVSMINLARIRSVRDLASGYQGFGTNAAVRFVLLLALRALKSRSRDRHEPDQ